MKNTKKLILSLVSMLVITGFLLAGTVNIVSAATTPIGQINNLRPTGYFNCSTRSMSFDTKNVGFCGTVWSKVYKQTGSSWTLIYSYQKSLSSGSYYSNSAKSLRIYGLTPYKSYQFKVQVGHYVLNSPIIDQTQYISL